MTAKKLAVSLRVACLALMLGVIAGPVRADTSAASVAMAKEILTLKGADAVFKPFVANVVNAARGQFLQTNPNLGKDLDEVALKIAGEYNPKTSQLLDQAAKFYAERFSADELKQILAFYKSPLGKKVIVTEPRVLDQSMRYANQWAQKLSLEIIDRMRTEMKKRGHDL